MNNNPTDQDYSQPVAYDKDGQPLYTHPPVRQTGEQESATRAIHVERAIEPAKVTISPDLQLKHERAVAAYPSLNLSEHEYVVLEVQRHPIGLLPAFLVGALLLLVPLLILSNYDLIVQSLHLTGPLSQLSIVGWPLLAWIVCVLLGMCAVVYVYTKNRFYLTNESVIQEIQLTLFSHQEQTASLENVEDASYTQQGVCQYIFNYGSIRLSTVGDETTYRFSFVSHPKYSIEILNNAVEAFKNGRPIENPPELGN